jgi:hypothetical protein
MPEFGMETDLTSPYGGGMTKRKNEREEGGNSIVSR